MACDKELYLPQSRSVQLRTPQLYLCCLSLLKTTEGEGKEEEKDSSSCFLVGKVEGRSYSAGKRIFTWGSHHFLA